MPGIACQTVDVAGGVQLAGLQTKFKVRGLLAVVLGDHVESHPPEPPHTGDPVMVSASPKFFITGIPVCRLGDLASCGHATTGRDFYLIP